MESHLYLELTDQTTCEMGIADLSCLTPLIHGNLQLSNEIVTCVLPLSSSEHGLFSGAYTDFIKYAVLHLWTDRDY